MAFAGGSGRAQRPLEGGATRESIAQDCRDAALGFMAGVAAGWDKRALALWLTGPYAQATRHARQGERVAEIAETEEVEPAAVDELLGHTHAQLMSSLERAGAEVGILDFSEGCIARGHVQKVVDAEGRPAWIPVDGARMRLRDRLRSLFTADYLNAPFSYAELFVCARCAAIVFDEHTKAEGICGIHRASDVVPRHRNEDVLASLPERGARA
jgi:hypothetical protein